MIFKTTTDVNGEVGNHLNKNIKDLFNGNFFAPQSFSLSEVLSSAELEDVEKYNNEFDRLKNIVANSSTNVKDATIAQKAFDNTLRNSSSTVQTLQANTNGGKIAIDGLTKASKAAELGMRGLALAGNMLASFLAAFALQAVITGIDNYIHRVDNARKALEEFNSTVQEQQNNLSSQKEWIDKNGTQYEKLAEGVDQYGHNISLASDEFTEYKNLTKEIANMFPSMVQGYNDQNEAILKNKGSVEELTDAYEKNQKAYYNDIMAKSGDTFDKFKTVTKSDLSKKNKLSDLINSNFSKEQTEGLLSNYAAFESTFGKTLGKSLTKELFNALNDEFKHNATLISGQSFDAIDFTKISPQLQEKVRSVFSELNQTIDTESEKVRPILQAYLYGQSSGYSSLDDTAKSAVQSFVQNVDSSFFEQFDSDTDMETWLTNNVINPLKDGINNEDLAVRIQTLFSLNEKDFKSYADYVKAVLDIINNLAQMTDKNGKKIYTKQQINNLKTQFGVGDVDSDGNVSGQKKIDNAVAKFKNIKGADKYIRELNEDDLETVLYKLEPDKVTSLKDLKDFVENDVTSETQKATNQSFEEAWGSLKDSEQKKFTTLLKNGRLTAETFNEVGDAADTLKATGLSVNTLCDNIRSFVGLQTKLENMSTAFKKVGTAYQDFKKNGYVSTSSLNSMPDAFKNLKGYSDFSKVAGNKKSSKSEIQGAFNDIVSEYINTFHILDNVTDKTKNKIITALRDAGVTNANDLIRQYERVGAKNQELINTAEKNYINYLNSKGKKNEITDNQINKLNSTLINALGKQYQDDYTNWISLLEKKQKAYNQFVKAYNSAQSRAYTESKKGSEGESAYSIYSNVKEKKRQYDLAKKKSDKASKKIKDDLQIVHAEFDAKYTPTTSSSNSGSGSGSGNQKSKDSKQEIDWIARKLEVLQKAIDTTSGKLQNLFSIKAKKSNINKQITETTKLLNANRKAAKAYNAEANKVVIDKKNKKRDSQLKANVRSGDYDITKYDSKTADKINKYQDLIDKAREAQDAVQDNIASIHDLNQQKLDNITTWYDKLLEKIDAVTSKYQAKSDLTIKIRSMLGQAETGTKTEYKDTLKSQTEALKTSQKEYKAYEKERKAQRKELTGQTNATNRSDRKTTKEFLKRSGLSDAQIKKELKKFDTQRGKLKDKQLDDFDATTKEQSAQLKETVISSLSDMIDTAQDLANIPIEKLQKTLDNLSTDFSKLENQASRASKQLEDVGIGLGYLEKVNASKISNKQTAVNNAGTTYRNAVSNRDSLATQLRSNGVDINSIKTSDDLIKFADNSPLASLASQYLASINAVDSAFKTLNETSEDLRNTIDDVVSSEVDAKNKLFDQDIEESDRRLENWKKEHSYKDNTINNVAPSAYFDTNKDVNKYSGNKINAIIYAAEHSNHADDYSLKADSYRNDARGIANWLKGIHGMYTGSLNSVFSQIEDLTANFEVIPEEILETIKKEAPDQLENLVKYNEYWKQSSDYSTKAEDAQYTYDYETVPQMYKDIFAAISADADRTVGDIQDDIDHIENYLQDNLLTDTTDSYMQEASKYRDQADVYAKEVADKEKWLAEAVANGMVKGSDDWNTLNDEIETAKKNQEESSRNYTNALVNAFNSIGDIADRSIKEIDKNLSRLNSEISMLEAQGHFITSDFYDQQGDYYAQQQAANEKKASDLQADLDSLVESGDIKEYSARWYEMKDKIDDATQSALDFGVKVKETEKSAFDAILQLGEKSREAITRMNDEADFYQDILGRDKLVDEKTGAFTSNGLASMSLSYEKMTNDIVNKNNIQKEIDKVKKRYANGTNDDYGIEQYNKDMDNLLSQQREAIKNYYDERDAVMQLVEDGLNKQLEVLQDIVDKYKEAMDKASDLRDYQNSVDDATKNIASLQKQLEVVRGNDSEEGRATAQSLQKQLEDAQKDLDDIEWDKKKSDMEDILDQMMNDAQDFINDKLDQITDSIDQIRDLLPENAQEVFNTLKGIDAKWGTQISDNLAEGVKLGDYSTILSGMDSAAAKIAQAVYDAEKAKLERTETPTPTPETPSTDNNSSNNSGSQSGQTVSGSEQSDESTKSSLKKMIRKYMLNPSAVSNEDSEYRSEFDDFISSLGFSGVIPDQNINKMLVDLGDTSAISLPLQYRIDQLKNDLQRRIESIGGFSRGGIVDKINKQVRRNNDDALISVKSGEGILTPQQTEMFQKLVENMPSLVDLSKIKLPTLPSSANSSKNITVEMGDMHFDLPNVTDTDSFINAWKTDTKLKNFVADVVSGTVTGDNSKAMRY